MMKIAFLTHIHPYITQTFTFNEIRFWRKSGIQLDVISLRKPSVNNVKILPEEMRKEERTTLYFSNLRFVYWLKGLILILINPGPAFQTLWHVMSTPYLRFTTWKLRLQAILTWLRAVVLTPFIQENKYDHLHADFADDAATIAWIISRFLGVPYSFRSHTSYNPHLLSRKLRDAKFVLAISRYDKDRLIRETRQNLNNNVVVGYLGVDLREWPYNGKVTHSNLIVCVGTLQEKKGQLNLIEACAILNREGISFRCLLIGDGPMRVRLEREIKNKQLPDKIELLGYLPNDRVKALMSQAAVLCMPSVVAPSGDVDGIPYVLMEAMALGKPCVSTPVSGISELIRHEVDGLLAQEGDPVSLAFALKRLLADPELRTRLGKAARKKIEMTFDAERNARQCLEMLAF